MAKLTEGKTRGNIKKSNPGPRPIKGPNGSHPPVKKEKGMFFSCIYDDEKDRGIHEVSLMDATTEEEVDREVNSLISGGMVDGVQEVGVFKVVSAGRYKFTMQKQVEVIKK